MDSLAELRDRTAAWLCIDCGKCTASCPLARFGSFSPRGLVALDDRRLIEDHRPGIERCLTCGSCQERCPQGVRFTEFIRGARERLAPEGRSPCPHGAVLSSASRMMAREHLPGARSQWLGEDLRVAEQGQLALFVGCLPLFDALFGERLGIRTLDIARAAIRLLNRLDIEPVLIAEERCCGHDALWSGERETFERLATANAQAFAARGIRHILTTCAECCRTWRLDYPEAAPDYRPRVQHLMEFLAERVDSGKLTFGNGQPAAVTYHDACRLGRHLQVYDAPRKVLQAAGGAPPMDMERSGRDAPCCGTSGFLHCDACSRALQAQRLRSAAGTGADTLVTTCPKCLIHFTCAQCEDRHQGREPGIALQDATVFAAARLPDESMPAGALRDTDRQPRTANTGGQS